MFGLHDVRAHKHRAKHNDRFRPIVSRSTGEGAAGSFRASAPVAEIAVLTYDVAELGHSIGDARELRTLSVNGPARAFAPLPQSFILGAFRRSSEGLCAVVLR
jgi:hypothetical protein